MSQPWTKLYSPGLPESIEPQFTTAAEMVRDAFQRSPNAIAMRSFGCDLKWSDTDRLSGALAGGFTRLGVTAGDRVAICTQNIPQFPIAVFAAWRLGAVVVPINPMLKQRELEVILEDSGAMVAVCESSMADLFAKTFDGTVIATDPTTYAPELPADLYERRTEGPVHHYWDDLVSRKPLTVWTEVTPDEPAFLTYTSGTTGPPKGAINTHANVAFNAEVYRRWMQLDQSDSILTVAPLFHITGSIGHLALACRLPAPLILTYRFHPKVVEDLIERYRPTFTVGAITAFIALMNEPTARDRDWSSLKKIYSGGAPISPATVKEFESITGTYIHNIYGLTETTSPSHAVPLGTRAPVDPTSGALSVGVPVFDTIVEIIDENGDPLPAGQVGEIVTRGPQVVPGYWNKDEETERAIPGGALHTGDVGFMDQDGWFYLVDRKKDMIIASGYKVWPREVEDVLYMHPAVREAAVIGVADDYRGETVKAFVSLKASTVAEPDELIAHCKERMAAYKYPRIVEILDELPKTPTGKILRRELRSADPVQ